MFVLIDYDNWAAYTYHTEEELISLVKQHRTMTPNELVDFLEVMKGNPEYIDIHEFIGEWALDIFEVKNVFSN